MYLDLAKELYETFFDSVGGMLTPEVPMPDWDNMPSELQLGWLKVAQKAVDSMYNVPESQIK